MTALLSPEEAGSLLEPTVFELKIGVEGADGRGGG
jgi:hypothetical protein